jgi:hypothetical protein
MDSFCASRAGSWKTRLRHWLLRLTDHMRSAHLPERMDAGARARWRLTYGSIDRCRLNGNASGCCNGNSVNPAHSQAKAAFPG